VGRTDARGQGGIAGGVVSGALACTRTRLAVAITSPDGKVSRARGYTLSVFRKQGDGRWLLARDANLLTPEIVG
jgi:ketosteroid isomerase-like protein